MTDERLFIIKKDGVKFNYNHFDAVTFDYRIGFDLIKIFKKDIKDRSNEINKINKSLEVELQQLDKREKNSLKTSFKSFDLIDLVKHNINNIYEPWKLNTENLSMNLYNNLKNNNLNNIKSNYFLKAQIPIVKEYRNKLD